MQFEEAEIDGVFIVAEQAFEDARGSFARAFCKDTFAQMGLASDMVQCNLSSNPQSGTLRGIHFQAPPVAEAKFVRCVRGAIFDVAVDLRKDSPTYLRSVGVELTQDNGKSLYIPAYCAHGYQTLSDNSTVYYHVSAPYTPGAEGGLRYDDPALAIPWPLPVAAISIKDQQWALL